MDLKTKTIKTARSLGRLVFTAGFFIAAAAFALILARGNTFTEEGITAIGTIKISIDNDEDLKITLNGKRKKLSTNSTIDSVIPGTYTLLLEKNGFSDWEQKVLVNAGFVTEVSIQLFPIDLKLEQIETKNISRIFYSEDRGKAYYFVTNSQIGSNVGLWQRDLNNPTFSFTETNRSLKISNLSSLLKSSAEGRTVQILPSPDNRKILVDTGDFMYLLDTDRFNEPVRSNRLDISFPVTDLTWLQNSSNLLIQSENLLLDYNVNEKSSTVVAYNGVSQPIFASTKEIVYYYQDNKLYKYSSGSSSPVSLVNVRLPENIVRIFSAGENQDDLILESENGLHFLNLEQSILQALGNFEFLSVSPSGRSLIVRNSEGIKSIRVSISRLLDRVDISISETELPDEINPSSIVWATNSSYFIYLDDSVSTKVFSADHRGKNKQELIQEERIDSDSLSLKPDNSGLLLLIMGAERSTLYELGFGVE